jgi:hypothetical protein
MELASGHRIEILPDPDAPSPRSWDNLGTFQIYHRRYASPDPIERDPPFIRADEIGLKVWAYDHSGLVYRTGETNPFHCPWDSGFAGIIFCSRARARDWLGVRRPARADIERILADEVRLYSDWVNGEVYGYRLFDPHGHEVDACWGFYGRDRAHLIATAKEGATHG